jgi:uncharacterized protein DUF1570
MRQIVMLVTVLATVGCAHYQMKCPHDGGPRWIELTSTHFALRTDVPEKQARDVLARSEEILGNMNAVLDFLMPATSDVGRMNVIMFSEVWELTQVSSGGQAAFEIMLGEEKTFDEGSGKRPMVVLAADVHAAETFRHELTHRLVEQRIGHVPPWLAEGLAEYFSQIKMAGDKVVLGAITHRAELFIHRRLVHNASTAEPSRDDLPAPLAWVFEGRCPNSVENCYVSAWAFVHYLANGGADHADRFRRLVAAIADGRSDRGATMEKEYGNAAQLEEANRLHWRALADGKVLQWVMPFTPPTRTGDDVVLKRWLDDAEVHELKATLREDARDRELALARAHGDSAALHRWLAVVADARHDDATAEREIAAATQRAPDDSFYAFERARIMLAHELRKPEAQRHLDAVASVLSPVADRMEEPEQLRTFAQLEAALGDVAHGLPVAERLVTLEPQCVGCWSALAALSFANGQLARAVAAQERANHRLRKTPTTEMTALVEKYRSARDQAASSPTNRDSSK